MEHSAATLSPALKRFVRMRASLKDEPVVIYWHGSMYHHVTPHEATEDYPPTVGSNPLMKVAGFNIGRAYYDRDIPLAGGQLGHGYYFLGRELQLYLDPQTEQLLDRWENPLLPRNVDGTGGRVARSVNVLQLANSPVCWKWAEPYERSAGGLRVFDTPGIADALAYEESGPLALYAIDLFGKNPGVLDTPDGRYARHSSGPIENFAEIMHFFGKRDELNDAGVSNAQDVTLSWTRTGPYWPWMHMGRAPGSVIISAAGFKVPGGFDGLPAALRQIAIGRFPEFTEPVQGIWQPGYERIVLTVDYFKREFDAGRYIPTAIP